MSNKSISATNLFHALHSPHPPVVFDVRKNSAFAEDPNILPTAIRQAHDQVHIWARDMPRDRPVIVYCVHGHEVSRNAATALCKMGFDVKYLEGGFEGWKNIGLSTQKGAKQ